MANEHKSAEPIYIRPRAHDLQLAEDHPITQSCDFKLLCEMMLPCWALGLEIRKVYLQDKIEADSRKIDLFRLKKIEHHVFFDHSCL